MIRLSLILLIGLVLPTSVVATSLSRKQHEMLTPSPVMGKRLLQATRYPVGFLAFD